MLYLELCYRNTKSDYMEEFEWMLRARLFGEELLKLSIKVIFVVLPWYLGNLKIPKNPGGQNEPNTSVTRV